MVRWAIPLAGAWLALLLLFTLYHDLDLTRLWDALATADIKWLAMLAAAITFAQLIRGWKWHQILFDLKPIPSRRLFGAIQSITRRLRDWHWYRHRDPGGCRRAGLGDDHIQLRHHHAVDGRSRVGDSMVQRHRDQVIGFHHEH